MISRGAETREGGAKGVWEGGVTPTPPLHPPLLSCFLNACQESLMAVEFGQEKSGAGSFRGSGDLCLTKAAPLFVFSQAERDRQAERMKDGGRASESFSKRTAQASGGGRPQTGRDHLTSRTACMTTHRTIQRQTARHPCTPNTQRRFRQNTRTRLHAAANHKGTH